MMTELLDFVGIVGFVGTWPNQIASLTAQAIVIASKKVLTLKLGIPYARHHKRHSIAYYLSSPLR
jgi:hypothetical protein